MINFNLIWLFLTLFVFISPLIFVVAGVLLFRRDEKEQYSFYNRFPYELLYDEKNKLKSQYIPFIVILLIGSLSPLGAIIPEGSKNPLFGYLFLISFLSVLSMIFFISLILTPVRFYKEHQIIFIIYLSITTLFSASVMILSTVFSFKDATIISPVHLFYAILSLLNLIVLIILIFNPKLKNWAKLDKEVKDDGTLVLTRPKFFALAYTEWVAFLIQNISLLILMLSLLNYTMK